MDALIRRLKEFYASLPSEGEARLELPPVATLEQVERAEQRIGFPLPELLRELYLEVGNGGWGTGLMLLPNNNFCGLGYSLEEAVKIYVSNRRFYGKYELASQWNQKLGQRFPICDGGCQYIVVLDCSTANGSVVQYDASGFLSDEAFDLKAPTLQSWLESWLANQAQELARNMHDE